MPGSTPGQSGEQSDQNGQSGQSQTPGEQPGGTEGDGNGTLNQPTWDPATGGAPGGAQSSEPPGGQSGGQPGSSQSSSPGGEDSWETGLPGGSEGGWETSNQVPGESANIPPMPSERGLPPGQGSGSGAGGDSELDAALEDFDGEILAEREVIQARSNERAGTGGASGALPSATQSGGLPEDGDPGGATQQTGGYEPRGMPSQNSPQKAPPAQAGNIPDDIPDARDDDIIARQLREAAMNETDPELREKLWEEYRRYKGA